ncbi:MAG TPA: DNA polymerase III subunit gamma/tau, partial [Sphingobium sp.]|nr:DNA polymerase III subunit gamma/tau [Sphingobium sp.]
QVREMLGLSDRGAVRRLLGLLLAGDTGSLIGAVRDQYALGVEPLALMRGLLELVHAVTLLKAGRDIASPGQSAEEREALAAWASQIGFAPLHRLWQLLLKGHDEVASAAFPIESCEMALLRVMHAAAMPDPGELARLLRDGAPPAAPTAAAGSPAVNGSGNSAGALPATFEALIDLLFDRGKGQLSQHLKDCAGLSLYAPPLLEIKLTSPWFGTGDFHRELSQALKDITGTPWQVRQSEGPVALTLMEQEAERIAARRASIMETPVIKAAMAAFPDAELSDEPEQWSAER